MSEEVIKPSRLLKRSEVEKRVGLGRASIYARIAKKLFPDPVRDGDTTTVWWLESDIEAWIQAKVEKSRRAAS